MPEELGKRPEELYTEHETRSKDLEELTSIENGEEADIAALREINSKLTAIKAHVESRDVDGIKKLLQLDRIQEVEAVVGKLIDEFTEFIAQNDPNYIVKKEMAQGAIDANLWRAQQHLRANEAAYKQKAVNEAQAAGKDVKYGPYTNADPVYDYDKHRKLVFDANSDPKPVTVEEFTIQNKQIQAERDVALADPTLSDDEKFDKFVDAHRKSTELERRSPFRSDPDTQVSRYNRKFAMEVSTETDIDKLNQDLQSAERDISRLNDQLRRAEDLDDQELISRFEAELQKLLGDASIIRWRIVRLREQDEDALSAPDSALIDYENENNHDTEVRLKDEEILGNLLAEINEIDIESKLDEASKLRRVQLNSQIEALLNELMGEFGFKIPLLDEMRGRVLEDRLESNTLRTQFIKTNSMLHPEEKRRELYRLEQQRKDIIERMVDEENEAAIAARYEQDRIAEARLEQGNIAAPPPPPSANLPTEEPEWDRPVFED